MSTQEGFGRLLTHIAREHSQLADRIITTSPDVTVSTNLAGWVNRRGVFDQQQQEDFSRQENIASAVRWSIGPAGQHIELEIAENNLFILLGALGLAGPLFGTRLLPIGTVYDPFICRGLDALNYACYQDARFILVATPSGVTLAPEGGAHQSVYTPLIGMGQPRLTMMEPAYVDELAEMLRWSFEHIQDEKGGAVYLRLSSRSLEQPQRALTAEMRQHIIDGGYWLIPPAEGAGLAVVACGAIIPEAIQAHEEIIEDFRGAGLLVITSPDRLHNDWVRDRRNPDSSYSNQSAHIVSLLECLSESAGLVTVLDGHPAILSWLGAVGRHRIVPLGVDRFGQSGVIQDLYHEHRLDADAIIAAAASLHEDYL